MAISGIISVIKLESYFSYSPAFDAPVREFPSEYCHKALCGRTGMVYLCNCEKMEDMFAGFDTIHERDRHRDRRTDRQTDGQTPDDGIRRAYT